MIKKFFSAHRQIYFQRLANITIVMTLLVIGLGAYTRLTDAGLGCPDWPGCYGKLTAPLHDGHIAEIRETFPHAVIEPHKALNEMLHRYVAGILGLLVMMLVIGSFILKRWRILCGVLGGLIILQALLGMWTVTLNLIPLVVMAHLLGGFLLFSLLVLLRLELLAEAFPYTPEPQLRPFLPFAYIALCILLLQIALGGWTSANYAALACTQLPFCEAGWQTRFSLESIFHLPLGHETYEYGVLPYEARMSIHIAHRFGAVLTTIILGSLLIGCWRRAQSVAIKKLILVMGTILIMQITLGVLNVYWHLPLINAVAHNLVAANLLMLLVAFVQQLHRRTKPLAASDRNVVSVASASH
jgi:heme a synthase